MDDALCRKCGKLPPKRKDELYCKRCAKEIVTSLRGSDYIDGSSGIRTLAGSQRAEEMDRTPLDPFAQAGAAEGMRVGDADRDETGLNYGSDE